MKNWPAGSGKLMLLVLTLSGFTANAAPVDPTQSRSVAPYESAFSDYRRFADQPVGDWREANALVGRIGGWRAYAQESQRAAPAASPAADVPGSPGADAPAATPPGSAHDTHHR